MTIWTHYTFKGANRKLLQAFLHLCMPFLICDMFRLCVNYGMFFAPKELRKICTYQ